MIITHAQTRAVCHIGVGRLCTFELTWKRFPLRAARGGAASAQAEAAVGCCGLGFSKLLPLTTSFVPAGLWPQASHG